MRQKKTILNSIFGVITLFIITLLSFVLSKFFIQNLGIQYNGLNGIFSNVIAILSITELGIAGSINFALYKPIFEKDYEKVASYMLFFKKAYKVIGIIVLSLSFIISIIIPFLIKDSNFSSQYIRTVFIIYALNSSISYFLSYNRSLFYAYQENYYITLIDFIFRLIKTFLQLYLLIKFKNYILFLIINIVATLLNNLTIRLLARKKYKNILIEPKALDKKSKNMIFSSIKSLGIIQLMSASINFTDNIIISSLIGITTAGFFVNYNMIITHLSAVINTIFNGIGASLGNLIAENNKSRITIVLYNLEYLGFFISLTCTICLLFLTQPFIANIWLGKDFLLSPIFLAILIVNLYLSIHRQTINYYLRMSGNFKDIVIPITIEAIINLILSLILAKKIGLIGVIIGTLISNLIGFILTSNKYNKHIERSSIIYWKKQFEFLVITILDIYIVNIITTIIKSSNNLINFIILFLVSLLVSFITIIFKILKDDKLDVFQNIINKYYHRRNNEINKG